MASSKKSTMIPFDQRQNIIKNDDKALIISH